MLQRKESATNAQQGKKYGRPQQYETGQGNVNSGGQDLVAQGQSWLSVDHDQGIGAGWRGFLSIQDGDFSQVQRPVGQAGHHQGSIGFMF